MYPPRAFIRFEGGPALSPCMNFSPPKGDGVFNLYPNFHDDRVNGVEVDPFQPYLQQHICTNFYSNRFNGFGVYRTQADINIYEPLQFLYNR